MIMKVKYNLSHYFELELNEIDSLYGRKLTKQDKERIKELVESWDIDDIDWEELNDRLKEQLLDDYNFLDCIEEQIWSE